MSNRASADQFYRAFGIERPVLSADEKADFTTILKAVLSFLGRMGRGPYTLLILPGEKLGALGIDAEGPLEKAKVDALVGWMLDLVLFGDVLSTGFDDALAHASAELNLSTVGGSSVTARREGGRIVLTDPWGATAAVGEAMFAGPLVTGRSVDDLLMWGGWKDAFQT